MPLYWVCPGCSRAPTPWRRLVCIVRYGCPDNIELFLSLFTLMWGIYFLFAVKLFDTALYVGLRYVFRHEWILGVILALTGLTRLVSLVFQCVGMRRLVGFWGCLLWIFLSASFWLSGWGGAVIPVTSLVAVTSMWVYWRLPVVPVVFTPAGLSVSR